MSLLLAMVRDIYEHKWAWTHGTLVNFVLIIIGKYNFHGEVRFFFFFDKGFEELRYSSRITDSV